MLSREDLLRILSYSALRTQHSALLFPLPFSDAFMYIRSMPDPTLGSAAERFGELVLLIARLRAPGGCPWDREQTHQSLKPMMLEEAYEVIEAIDEGNDEEFKGELGDLLLQVVFHSQIATEEDRFTVAEVIERIASKMIRRHPHVFAEDTAETAGEVLRNWEAIKEAELEAKGKRSDEGSMLDSRFDKAAGGDGSVSNDDQGFPRGFRLARCRFGIGKTRRRSGRVEAGGWQ